MCKRDIWLQGLGTEGRFSPGGSTPQLLGKAGPSISSPGPHCAALLKPQPGQSITHALRGAEMFQNIWKRQRLPKSDKMDPHCKITLPRSAYATDQNCQVIPILLLEQKMTLFHMHTNTAPHCTGIKLHSLSPKEALQGMQLPQPQPEDFLPSRAQWPSPLGTLSHRTSSARHWALQ